jgi:hypothetical protein
MRGCEEEKPGDSSWHSKEENFQKPTLEKLETSK